MTGPEAMIERVIIVRIDYKRTLMEKDSVTGIGTEALIEIAMITRIDDRQARMEEETAVFLKEL